MEIMIDKRVELLAVVQTLDNYWDNLSLTFSNSKLFQCKYKENIWNYFKKYENHDSVKLYNELSSNVQDISVFLTLVLCYSNFPNMVNIANPVSNIEYVLKSEFPFDKFINGLKQFYYDTEFEYFFGNNQKEYEKILNDYGNREEIMKYTDIVDNYYDAESKHYTTIISALIMGNFGIRIEANKNIVFNYTILSPYDYKDNKYKFGDKAQIKSTLWHEIGHQTINDLTRKYINQFNINNKTIPGNFIKIFYTSIETIINEYIIRAITIRLFEMQHEEEMAELLLKKDIEKGFKEIGKVKNYIEENNEKNNKLLKNEKYKELINYVISII